MIDSCSASSGSGQSPPRQLACAQCGAVFECRLGGGCWCDEEPYRLRVPLPGTADCLCRNCLRQAAAQQTGGQPAR